MDRPERLSPVAFSGANENGAFMEKPSLVVALPAFNEEGNLPSLIEDIHHVVPDALILVVDDGSTDGTGAVAEKAAESKPVVLVTHERNMGLGRAVNTALKNAVRLARDNGAVVLMDADGTHRPEQIPELVARAEAGADLVVAGRYLPGAKVAGVSFFRRVLSGGARFLSHLIFGNIVARDVSCGFRLYKVPLLRRAREAYGKRFIVSQGFSISVELLVKLAKIGAKIDQIPLDLRYDLKMGKSKIRIVRTVWQYLKTYIHLAFVRPAPTGGDGGSAKEAL